VAILLLFSPAASAQVPVPYFRENCTACHTIGGGRLTGPDLKGVTTRKDRPWLVKFIQNPQAVIDAGDPYARQLLDEAGGVIAAAARRAGVAEAPRPDDGVKLTVVFTACN
jgi:mono/diheme cytochrome c family protein